VCVESLQGPKVVIYRFNSTVANIDVNGTLIQSYRKSFVFRKPSGKADVAWADSLDESETGDQGLFGGETRIAALARHFAKMRDSGARLMVVTDKALSCYYVYSKLRSVDLAKYFQYEDIVAIASDEDRSSFDLLRNETALGDLVHDTRRALGLHRDEVFFTDIPFHPSTHSSILPVLSFLYYYTRMRVLIRASLL
jgi:hypothetical protein